MARLLALAGGEMALVDDEDFARVSQHSWYDNGRGYAITTLYNPKRTVSLHRLVMNAQPGEEVDHRNGNKLDCRKENLRKATRGQNNRNIEKRRDAFHSQYKGVRKMPNCERWQATITVQGRKRYLGLHKTEEAAAMAYDEAAIELFGEFAVLNFPREGYRCIEKRSSTTERPATTPAILMAS